MGLWNVYVCVRGFVCVCMLLYVKCELCFSVCIRRGVEGIGVGEWGVRVDSSVSIFVDRI